MKPLCDYHTHTVLCDGKNTVSEMADTAFALGFSTLGLSGHGYTHFDESFCMSKEGVAKYIAEIQKTKKEYEGRMTVLAGIEQDMYSKEDVSMFDYRIGSVHYLKIDGEYYPVDLSPDDMKNYIDTFFGGDFEALAEHYYHEVGELFDHIDADIIGHFDLITKFCDLIPLKMTDRYYSAAFAAIDKLIPYGKPFEINVGAITRGYRTTPYPDKRLLEHIRECGGEIIVCGDCHAASNLGMHLELACEVAKNAGFTHRLILTEKGYERIEL